MFDGISRSLSIFQRKRQREPKQDEREEGTAPPENTVPYGPPTLKTYFRAYLKAHKNDPIQLRVLQTSIEPSPFRSRRKPMRGQVFPRKLQPLWEAFSREIHDALQMQRQDVCGFSCLTADCVNIDKSEFYQQLEMLSAWHSLFSVFKGAGGEAHIFCMDTKITVEDSVVHIGNARMDRSRWDKLQSLHSRLRKFITEGLPHTTTQRDVGDSDTWASMRNSDLRFFYFDAWGWYYIVMHRLCMQTLHTDGKRLVEWMRAIAQDQLMQTFEQSSTRAFSLSFDFAMNGILVDMKYKDNCADGRAEHLLTSRRVKDPKPCLMLFQWCPSEKMYERMTAGMFDTDAHRAAAEWLADHYRWSEDYISKQIRQESQDIDALAYERAKIQVIEDLTALVVIPLRFEALIGFAVHWEFLVACGAPCTLRGYRPENKRCMKSLLKRGDGGRSIYLVGRVRRALIDREKSSQDYELRDITPQYIAIQPPLGDAS